MAKHFDAAARTDDALGRGRGKRAAAFRALAVQTNLLRRGSVDGPATPVYIAAKLPALDKLVKPVRCRGRTCLEQTGQFIQADPAAQIDPG